MLSHQSHHITHSMLSHHSLTHLLDDVTSLTRYMLTISLTQQYDSDYDDEGMGGEQTSKKPKLDGMLE